MGRGGERVPRDRMAICLLTSYENFNLGPLGRELVGSGGVHLDKVV